MQKRQYCMWGTVFSLALSEGIRAQGMGCEDSSEKYPPTANTRVCCAHFYGGKCQDTFFRSCKTCVDRGCKKERLIHISQAERFLDEVDMEVDENMILAGKLTDSESSEEADEEEDPVSWEGNVKDHVKALRNRARQFEGGCVTVCDDFMEERKKIVEPFLPCSVIYSWYSSLVFTPYWALLLGVPLSFALRLAQHLGVLSTVALAGGYRQVAGGRWGTEVTNLELPRRR